MKSRRFWIPVAVFFGLTPFFLFLGLVSAGVGEGKYFLAKMLFPFTMLSTVPFHSIRRPFILLAVVQYPLYGLLVGIANLKRTLLICGFALAIIHISLVVACLLLPERFYEAGVGVKRTFE
jgi:hypothetical protein